MFCKHEWKKIRTKVSAASAWAQVFYKCKKCDKGRTRQGKTIYSYHIKIPSHKHTISSLWGNGSDYPPPFVMIFCENCNKSTYSRRRNFEEEYRHWCSSCETGSFIFYYYAPCCIETLKSVEPDPKKWEKKSV